MPIKGNKTELEKEPIDIFAGKEETGIKPEKEPLPEEKEVIERPLQEEKAEKPSGKIAAPVLTEEKPRPLQERPATPERREIENILEENLKDIYSQMDEIQQRAFKQEGEKVASRIEILLKNARDKSKEILRLILGWLKIIPGVNKFFLEKEAKIKADRIMALKENLREKGKGRD